MTSHHVLTVQGPSTPSPNKKKICPSLSGSARSQGRKQRQNMQCSVVLVQGACLQFRPAILPMHLSPCSPAARTNSNEERKGALCRHSRPCVPVITQCPTASSSVHVCLRPSSMRRARQHNCRISARHGLGRLSIDPQPGFEQQETIFDLGPDMHAIWPSTHTDGESAHIRYANVRYNSALHSAYNGWKSRKSVNIKHVHIVVSRVWEDINTF